MSLFCQVGEKPIVRYKFADSKERFYRTDNSPIDVVMINEPSFNGGQCECVQYLVHGGIYFPGAQGNPAQWYGLNTTGWYGSILGVKLEHTSWGGDTVFINCRGHYNGQCQPQNDWHVWWNNGKGTQPTYTKAAIWNIIRIDNQPDNCGNLPLKARLEVKYNSQLIFWDEGKAEGIFNVFCGDCPKGYLKCEINKPPGYCCIPCSELKAEVKAMTQQVRRLNNG